MARSQSWTYPISRRPRASRGAQRARPYPGQVGEGTDLRDPHLRVPDERARLRARRRAARRRRVRESPRRARPLTWWCSTPARSGRTRPTGCTATSATCSRSRRRTRACRSPSAAAWRRWSAQQIIERAPWVDVVYGTHNIGALPRLLERARRAAGGAGRVRGDPRHLPVACCRPAASPRTRRGCRSRSAATTPARSASSRRCAAREKDRRPGDILEEITALVSDGVIEVTLLGQNVNSYGAEFGDRQAFGKLLRACGQIEGLERVRFTSPHPRDFTDDVIEAMAETPERDAEPAHAAAVRLGHGAEGDAPRLPPRPLPGDPGQRAARTSRTRRSPPTSSSVSPARRRPTSPTPSTWCGRPGSRPRSRSATRSVPGTPAATMDGPGSADVVQDRYDRLVALVEEIATAENARCDGTDVEVLVAEGEGRKDAATHRMSGRARDNRLVHFAPHETAPRPGDIVTTTVTSTAPHYLIADGAPLEVRRTRAGDAWQASQVAAAAAAGRRARRRPRAGPARHADPPLTGHADRRRRRHRHRQVRPGGGASRSPSAARWSTPTPCSSTGAWTSAPPSSRWPSAAGPAPPARRLGRHHDRERRRVPGTRG